MRRDATRRDVATIDDLLLAIFYFEIVRLRNERKIVKCAATRTWYVLRTTYYVCDEQRRAAPRRRSRLVTSVEYEYNYVLVVEAQRAATLSIL